MTLGLFDPAFLGGLAAGGGGYDADAQAYITAVEAADGQSLEVGVKDAYNTFFVGCKADGTFSALKASCILAGARTLSGALVPLVSTMPAPTNFNFVAGDYNRKTGLIADGSTKYLDSNRNNSTDPQNSKHIAAYQTEAPIANVSARCNIGCVGASFSQVGASVLLVAPSSLNNTLFCRANGQTSLQSAANDGLAIGFQGAVRSNSSQITIRANGSNYLGSSTSETPINTDLFIFARNASLASPTSPVDSYSNSRLSFYSIGESLNLALLDARVSTLMSDLAAAIP